MMTNSFLLWNYQNPIKVDTDISESVLKIASINKHLFVLTVTHQLYQGEVDGNHVRLEKCKDTDILDIDSCNNYLYTVNTNGEVHKRDENLQIINHIHLYEDSKTCLHGHNDTNKCPVPVSRISVNKFGHVFITTSGQLWASGYMPQIGIHSDVPKKVTFFDGRVVYSACVGYDFAVAVVNKHNVSEDTDSDEAGDERIFLSACPQCLSVSQGTSPISPNSENCPLGLKVHNSYDVETTSTSSKNSGSSLDMEKPYINGKDSPVETNDKSEKNIIFRNTEAAKQFLTKKISWVSSAGEEYLAECAEMPSRIIKENVTTMASFVYEGVKTVGDKVATLSRHVSGSSDCNDIPEIIDEVNITRPTSKEELLWSLSQCTSEHDLSENGFNDRVKMLLKKGSDLINCEVWTWGNISHGQLGIGDSIRRERPMIISKLSNIGVCKVSVESYHVSVLTLDGRAFLWGRNDHNQVTFDNKMDQSSPKVFVATPEQRTKDVMCGCYHTVILTDDITLKYIGVHVDKLADLYSLNKIDVQHTNGEANGHSSASQRPLFCDVLCSNNYTILNNVNTCDCLTENVSKLQRLMEVMLVVQTTIIKLLIKKCALLPDCVLYEQFCENFTNLLNIIATNVHSILEYSRGVTLEGDIPAVGYVDEFLYIYKKYLSSLCDILCVNGFKYILKILDIPQHMYKLVPNISRKDKNSDELLLDTLFKQPYDDLIVYVHIMEDLKKHSKWERKIVEIEQKWITFKERQQEELANALKTQQFWLQSGKFLDFLKTPDKRLVRDSHTYPLYLTNAGRFSSHQFILLSDIFVHVCSSLPIVHPLKTIWIDPQPSDTAYQYSIHLKMPEDVLTVYTTEPEDKVNWFHIFQDAIKAALNKKDARQPPFIRTASYTFTKNPFYKEAHYTGRWLNGKIHGVGKLEWPDGRTYTGHFSYNQISGFGRMEIPNYGVYEGQWKDNLQNGLGVFNYANGDMYKGNFKDGLPHGHGVLRKGSFKTSAASIYIGEWIAGSKSGYGVMDDITAGEKYLGNWCDNKKHGNGLIVTSEGVYYEGTFNQDMLTGFGLMILKDGTYYEGEFKGVGLLGGKGKLTMQSGHVIDGNLSGTWSEGVKISNATLSKVIRNAYSESGVSKPYSFETLCIPVSLKWKALFQHCFQALGISESSPNNNRTSDTRKIWQNVAVYLSNSKQNTLKKSSGGSLENSLNNLDVIPPYGRDTLDSGTYLKLRQYLTKAFDTTCHPLGSLLNDLCEAYTTTYGGMVAHPLLLTHAVSELHSITRRLYEVVRLLFPALPPYGRESLLKNEECAEVVSCQSLLFPLILPKVYSSLFILYILKNEHQELKYWKRLMEWNRQSDYTLMSFLSVHPKFLSNQAVSAKDHMFSEAVETLQQLKTTFSPTEKLSVIQDTIKKMTPVAREQLGESYIWNMDDLFPVFLYVVVRARILQLGSELDFIENFMEPSLESGELGIMFTTLKACYQHILQEKASIN